MSRSTTLRIGDQLHEVERTHDGRVVVHGHGELAVTEVGQGEYLVTAGDVQVSGWVAHAGDRRYVFVDGHVYEIDIVPSDARRRATVQHQEALAAPMPATVLKILTEEGATVADGDTLVVLEAMKMELPLRAPRAGTVTAIHCREGELVQPGVVLVEIA